MNLAIFGGTFDPIHRGHIAIARAAAERFKLARVLFVPADIPPHKAQVPITPFAHRFAMVALATAGEKRFYPSLLEALPPGREPVLNFSIDTVRRVKKTLRAGDRLFFLLGMDAFLGISRWREPEALLGEVEFIIASRPGFSLREVGQALPGTLRPDEEVLDALRKQPALGTIALPGVTIHMLGGIEEKASATAVREAAFAGRSLARFLDPAVAEYVKKLQLYRDAAPRAAPSGKVLSFNKPKRSSRKEGR